MTRRTIPAMVAAIAALIVSPMVFAQEPPAGPPDGSGRLGRGGPQGPRGPGGPGGRDGVGPMHDDQGEMHRLIMRHLYPLDLIREHAAEIELSDEQIDKMRKLVTDGIAETEQLKWDLAVSSRKLAEMIAKGAAKEQVYEQMDLIFKFENKLKKKHLGLLIVLRDILSAKQREALDEIKARRAPPRFDDGPAPKRMAPPAAGR